MVIVARRYTKGSLDKLNVRSALAVTRWRWP